MRRKHLILITIGSVATLPVLATMAVLVIGNSGWFLNRSGVNPSGTGDSFGSMGGGQGMMGSRVPTTPVNLRSPRTPAIRTDCC